MVSIAVLIRRLIVKTLHSVTLSLQLKTLNVGQLYTPFWRY